MPQKNFYHDLVVKLLLQDGWIITDDPLWLAYGGRNVYVDVGAEQPIGAEKEGRKIAVEIKSFLGESDVTELSESVGKFKLYQNILTETEPERALYLAVPLHVYESIFKEPIGQLMMERERLQLVVFDQKQKRIEKWIP